MIRIQRPANAPARLALGVAEVNSMEGAVAAFPLAGTASAPFSFKSSIYGHATVKSALRAAQHRKCAYCEAIFEGNSWGDVEHFRPKAYSQQAGGSEKIYPGYYWLAYSWSNLFYTCQLCNQAIKKNLFPLSNPASRARHRADDLAAESPLLVDPSDGDDPRNHIRFRRNKPYGLTEKGRRTIDVFGLGRLGLDDARIAHLRIIDALCTIASLPPENEEWRAISVTAKRQLEEMLDSASPFTAMAADFLGAD